MQGLQWVLQGGCTGLHSTAAPSRGLFSRGSAPQARQCRHTVHGSREKAMQRTHRLFHFWTLLIASLPRFALTGTSRCCLYDSTGPEEGLLVLNSLCSPRDAYYVNHASTSPNQHYVNYCPSLYFHIAQQGTKGPKWRFFFSLATKPWRACGFCPLLRIHGSPVLACFAAKVLLPDCSLPVVNRQRKREEGKEKRDAPDRNAKPK